MASDTASEPSSLKGEEVDSAASLALSSQPNSSRVEDEDAEERSERAEDGGGGEDEDEEQEEPDTDPLEPVAGQVRLAPSVFNGRQPTIFFDYPPELGETRQAPFVVQPLNARKMAFTTKWERNCVKNAFARAGFERVQGKGAWNANWGKHPSHKELAGMNRFQKVNHFPGSWCIGRKDRLMRTLHKFRRSHGATFHFHPEGFQLPIEKKILEMKIKAEKSIWIIKPSASSCGRGIRLIHPGNLNTLPSNKSAVVQRYLERPYLINGHKFDLRLYVVLTSVDPLRIYLFEHGLARFSTHKYTLKNLKSRFTHLTNYSVNKKSKHFVANEDPEQDGTGSKWSLGALWRHMEGELGVERTAQAKEDIKDLIVKTLVAAEADITPSLARLNRTRGLCYELFGFDVLLDAGLKPWLVEVNISPSLMGSSPLDRQIKGQLMADVFHLVGFVPYDERAVRKDQKVEKANKLRGVSSGRAKQQLARRQDAWRRNPSPDAIDLSELCEDDWDIVFESMDEFQRTGHFERIYPTASRVDEMLGYFQSTRFNDVLLARLVKTSSLRNFFQHSPLGLPSFLSQPAAHAESRHLPSPPRNSLPSPRCYPKRSGRLPPAPMAVAEGGGVIGVTASNSSPSSAASAEAPTAMIRRWEEGQERSRVEVVEDHGHHYFLDQGQGELAAAVLIRKGRKTRGSPSPDGAALHASRNDRLEMMQQYRRKVPLTVNVRLARVEGDGAANGRGPEPDPTPIMTMEPDEVYGTPLDQYFSSKVHMRDSLPPPGASRRPPRRVPRPVHHTTSEAAMSNSILSAAGNRQIWAGNGVEDSGPRWSARRGSGSGTSSRGLVAAQVFEMPQGEASQQRPRRNSLGSTQRRPSRAGLDSRG